VIEREYGTKYLPGVPRRYTSKAKNAQEAHEAIRPTDLGRLPAHVARRLDPEQARLYELIWIRTIASQMESAELERTTVDIRAQVAGRQLDLRATGQVVLFDGFLKLYQEGRDDEEDEESRRLPAMRQGDALTRKDIVTTQHFTEPPPRYTEASLVKRMEELGIGRPSTYASVLQTLRDREYVVIEKKRLQPAEKGLLVTAFLESFFGRYVEYGFTADMEEKLDLISDNKRDWRAVLAEFWKEFSASIEGTKELRIGDVLEALNGILGDHIFPPRPDGTDPRRCQTCGTGNLSLRLGKFGAFIGCSNYPECKFTRPLVATGDGDAEAGGMENGTKVLGEDPVTKLPVTLRDGRFGPYVQLGEGEKPKRQSLPKGLAPAALTFEKALALLSLPREVARHPESGEPIVASIGKFGPYVQHGKTYASLDRTDDVLEIGGNRAIDLIMAKEAGGGRRGGGSGPVAGRALGDHPEGGAITARPGKYGPYINWGKVNATLPKDMTQDSVTLDQALVLIAAKLASGGGGRGKAPARKSAAAKTATSKPAAARKPAAKKPKATAKKAT
jgi:DNA topoisomerase-1